MVNVVSPISNRIVYQYIQIIVIILTIVVIWVIYIITYEDIEVESQILCLTFVSIYFVYAKLKFVPI